MDQKAQAAPHSLKTKKNIRFRPEVPRDESHVSVGGLLALGYGRLRRLRKEVQSANCAEDKLTEIGSK
jgi:hypothetical protein